MASPWPALAPLSLRWGNAQVGDRAQAPTQSCLADMEVKK